MQHTISNKPHNNKNIFNIYQVQSTCGNATLQEWSGRPTAGGYADGNLSGPSAYQLGTIHRHVGRRRTIAVGVAITTPTAPFGLYIALGVVRVYSLGRDGAVTSLGFSYHYAVGPLGLVLAIFFSSTPTAPLGLV